MANGHGGARPNSGRNKVSDELKGFNLALPHVEDSFRVISEIMLNEQSNTRDRIAAAKILIEYGCGKPKETIEQTHIINDFDLKGALGFGKSK
jgi:hypothetical protein